MNPEGPDQDGTPELTSPSPQRVGRPRDRSIDERALEATRQLLVEEGFDRTTVQAVATRAGLHISAIYRRWPTKVDLIEEAAFSALPLQRTRPTGNLRGDLHRYVRGFVAAFQAPAFRAAAPGLMASWQASDRRPTEALLHLPWQQPTFYKILEAGLPRGTELGVDPEHVYYMVLGVVLVRLMVPAEVYRPASIDDTVELILRMIGSPP